MRCLDKILEVLKFCRSIHRKLDQILINQKKIMSTQSEESARLTAFTATLLAALQRIKDALANQTGATPELTAAVTAMGDAVAQADAVVPVPPPTP
jgi:hypothetical protein